MSVISCVSTYFPMQQIRSYCNYTVDVVKRVASRIFELIGQVFSFLANAVGECLSVLYVLLCPPRRISFNEYQSREAGRMMQDLQQRINQNSLTMNQMLLQQARENSLRMQQRNLQWLVSRSNSLSLRDFDFTPERDSLSGTSDSSDGESN